MWGVLLVLAVGFLWMLAQVFGFNMPLVINIGTDSQVSSVSAERVGNCTIIRKSPSSKVEQEVCADY